MAWFNCNTAIAQFKAVKIDKEKADIVNFYSNVGDVIIPEVKPTITPVQSGSGDPSPSNPRPISGWDSVKVSATGKNLIKAKYEGRTYNGVTYTVNSDGTIALANTATNTSYAAPNLNDQPDKLQLLPAGTYTLSGGYSSSIRLYLGGKYIDGTSLPSTYDSGSGITFTLTKGANVYPQIVVSNGTSTDLTIKPMLVKGSDSAEFEPFGQTATIPLPHTVYGGELDIVSGKLVVTHKQVDLGDYSYTKYSNKLFYANPTDKKNNTDIMCDSLKFAGNYSNATDANSMSNGQIGGFSNTESSNHWLYVCVTGDMTPTALKEYVTGMKAVFELSTPIEIDLTPVALNARNGTNNVWSDCGQTSLKYYEMRRATT